MAEAQTAAPERDFAARLFDAAPVPPVVAGALLAIGLIALLGVVAWLTGDLQDLRDGAEPWWQNRDARIGILIPAFLAAIATAARYHGLRTRENLDAVAALGGWRIEDIDPARRPGNASRERRVAIAGALMVPLLALLIDRDPSLYFRSDYWLASKVGYLGLAVLATVIAGVTGYRAIRDARHFSALARRLPQIDLLEPGRLAPFARQGLRCSVPGLLAITFIALNALDQGFLWAIVVMGGLGLVGVTAAFAIPLRGVRARVHRAKQEELARVHAAIRGEEASLRGSAIQGRESPSLADLLAYRAQIATFPEWPVDLSTLSRLALFVLIPLASWLGGALVERALDAALR